MRTRHVDSPLALDPEPPDGLFYLEDYLYDDDQGLATDILEPQSPIKNSPNNFALTGFTCRLAETVVPYQKKVMQRFQQCFRGISIEVL